MTGTVKPICVWGGVGGLTQALLGNVAPHSEHPGRDVQECQVENSPRPSCLSALGRPISYAPRQLTDTPLALLAMPTWLCTRPKAEHKGVLPQVCSQGLPSRIQALRRAPRGTNREDSRALGCAGQGRAAEGLRQRYQGSKAAGTFPGSRPLVAPEPTGAPRREDLLVV